MQRQMYMLCSLVLLISVLNVSVEAKDGDPTPAPTGSTAPTLPPDTTLAPITITFICNDHSIVTDIDISGGKYEQVRVLQPNGRYCDQEKTDKPSVLKCITTSYAEDKVIIMYGEEVHKGVIGGQHMKYFSISCKEKPAFRRASVAPDILTSSPKPMEIQHETSEVPKLSIKSPQDSIFVGQTMTLQMSIKDTYTIQPENCTAYKTAGDTNSYTFWDKCKTLDPAIVPGTTKWVSWMDNNISKGLQINMFAFKFIGSEKLVIECLTKICPPDEKTKCQEKCADTVVRRRRSNDNLLKLESKVKTQTASITLKVLDSHIGQQNGSQGLTSRWYITTIGLVIICWTSFQI